MIDIRVPPLGESVTEATVARWTKNEGDAVVAGETIVELETDKINVEVPAERDGVLKSRVKGVGDRVGVGDVLGSFDDTARADDTPAARAGQRPSGGVATPPASRPLAASPTTPGSSPLAHSPAPPLAQSQRAAPSAVRFATEHNIPLSGVKGTGRGGVVSKPDVMEQAAGHGPQATGKAASAPVVSGPRSQVPGPASRETR